ncbi:negative acting factor protein [Rutstroemia sp. NJR-2017a BBW]|nr:negative acting factor protein [Rutstroemia sp. NJR-2017a BBW]
MPFPSRGCRTCKSRRVKCDEARPICKRCKKGKFTCEGFENTDGLIFLNENEYVGGARKRPRGPNVSTTTSHGRSISRTPATPTNESQRPTILPPTRNMGTTHYCQQGLRLPTLQLPVLTVSLEDQALTYYSWSQGVATRTNLDHSTADLESITSFATAVVMRQEPLLSLSDCPNPILTLSILAISHASFGRARKVQSALAAGGAKYCKALKMINLALKDPLQATRDEILLATIILSHYENSIFRKPQISEHDIKSMAAKTFAHHDGAMAVLHLRRQRNHHQCDAMSANVDRVVRNHLIRSLIMRCMQVPVWLRDGAEYGEAGLALGLDRLMVETADLRHRAADLQYDLTTIPKAGRVAQMLKLHGVLATAQRLDESFVAWARDVPMEDYWRMFRVEDDGVVRDESNDDIFNGCVHIYPTMGHLGLWSRYRAFRLHVIDITVRILSFAKTIEVDLQSMEESARTKIEKLASDFCASIPHALKAVDIHPTAGNPVVSRRPPADQKHLAEATTARILCWPLAMTTLVESIPEQYAKYLKRRLLDVSEIVDDGLLERMATR